MVNFLRFKNSSIKVRILKSRKYDFFRINPIGLAKHGVKHLIRRGILTKGASIPTENHNHFVTPNFIINWAKTRFTDGDIHVGFTVSISATSKHACKRNLVRRRLKSIVNTNIRKYKVTGYDFIFTARSGILDASYKEILSDFKRAMKFAQKSIKFEKKEESGAQPPTNQDLS